MSTESATIVVTGVAPLDAALGGLEPGRAHVLYGELGSGKSTLAAQFVVEGLRRGEPCIFVIRYDPQEAVRAMAAFGYDCAGDLRSGRLVVLEYASDLVDQLAQIEDISAIMAEFGWLIGDGKPSRIVFDSADYIFSIQQGYGHALQITAFANWIDELGTTALFVVEERVNERIVQGFRACARTVVHAIRRTVGEEKEYHLVFEKAATKAQPHRTTLTPDGLVTHSVGDAALFRPSRVTAPLAASPRDARTGQLSPNEDAAKFIAQVVASTTPAPAPAPPPAVAQPAARSGTPRVLVIDEDPTIGRLVERVLSPEHDVQALPDGIAALATFQSFDPDLILLEATLPLIDGFTICRQIRATSTVPIIVVSGTRTKAADRIESAEAGADYYLIKPFSLRELSLRSRQLIARYRGRPAAAPSVATADPLMPLDSFRQRLDVTAMAAGIGIPATLIGCRLETNGSAETTRIVDVIRESLRAEDAMVFEPDSHRVVLLATCDVAAAREQASRIASVVRERAGVGVSFSLSAVPGSPEQALGALAAKLDRGDGASVQQGFLEFVR